MKNAIADKRGKMWWKYSRKAWEEYRKKLREYKNWWEKQRDFKRRLQLLLKEAVEMKWLFYTGRKGAFLSWGILKCPAGQEWAWECLSVRLHQEWEQLCPAGKGAASSLSQAQLPLSGLPTTATGKIFPLTLVTYLHFAINILSLFGFFFLSKLE